jgi:hypothetical protein
MKPCAWVACLVLTAAHVGSAIQVTQVAGAAHAYPQILDLNGKRLGTGEYVQEIQGDRLKVRITYHLKDGRVIEEKGTFHQGSEFSPKEWSWQERRAGIIQREYAIHFDSAQAMAHKHENGNERNWSEKIKVESGHTFAGFGFTLVLQNLRDRLRKGEAITLQAVGFTPKPRVVAVRLSYAGTDRVPMSERILPGEHFLVQPQIPAIAKLFIKISDTHIWLTPPPSGFLRWEGPLAEPSDPLVRVDFSSGGESGAAEVVSPKSPNK